MQIVTGATGKIGSRIVELCLNDNIDVLACSNNYEKLDILKDKGANVSSGNLYDCKYLENCFQSAEFVILNFPIVSKFFRIANNRRQLADKYFEIINKLSVPNVIVLSCISAGLGEGESSINDFNYIESLFKKYTKGNVIVLRNAFFMENLFNQIPLIKVIKSFSVPVNPNIKIPFVSKKDIAEIAFKYIKDQELPQGFIILNIHGPDYLTYNEITSAVRKAIDMPNLRFMQASPTLARTYLLDKDLILTDDIENQMQIFDLINKNKMNFYELAAFNYNYSTDISVFAQEFAAKYNNFLSNI